jgi:MYXO-CTERM domain-containing protein
MVGPPPETPILALVTLAQAAAPTAAELCEAIDIPTGDITSTTITGDGKAYSVETDLGILVPTEGAEFSWLYTGQVGVSPEPGTDLGAYGEKGDAVDLDVTLDVPLTANSLLIDFYFLSAEYPEWVGSAYNDAFEINVTGTAWTGNAAIDSVGNEVTVNSALFTVVDAASIDGTGFDGTGGGTGWLTVVIPVDPGDSLQLNFSIYDMSDGNYDSGTLLDNFRWEEGDIDEPTIVEAIALDYISPKRGPVAGGVSTNVYGEKFNSSCVAYFDDVEAVSTTYVSETQLTAEPAAHAAGMVDVDVKCTGTSDQIGSGYTYYEADAGDAGPVVTGADPYNVDVEGGEVIIVTGTGFVEGADVTVDGTPVAAAVNSDTEIQLTTEAHAEGLVDLVVTNPDGLEDTLSGALNYVDIATWPPEDTSAPQGDTGALPQNPKGDDATTDPAGCGCASGPDGGLAAGLLVLLAIRRRQA